jgi:hypothetical protein
MQPKTREKRVAHPASRRDLSLSDLFLFASIKTKLTKDTIPDRESVKDAIGSVFGEMGIEIHITAFEL